MEKNIEQRLFLIMSNIFNQPIGTISIKSSPDTIESWDSLSHMKLIIALEEEFNIELSEDQIVDMLSAELIILTLKDLNIH
jgi:acyl carrier protein